MTMLPAHNRNLSKQDKQHQQYKCGTGEEGGYGGSNHRHRYSSVMSEVEVEGYKNYWRESWLGSEWDMIEGKQMGDQDESRTTNSLSVSLNEGGGSTSKQDRDEGWLQLGIAGCDTQRPTSPSKHHEEEGREELGGSSSTPPSHRLVELELLPPPPPQQHHPPPPHLQGSGRPLLTYPPPSSNLVFQPPSFGHHHHHQQYSTWAFPPPMPMGMPSSSSPCASLRTTALPSYFASPFHFPASFDDAGAGPSSSDVRVVHPPRRPHSGIWFMLQASPNQAKEPFLPQIPKSYLRIKDGSMTVRLLLKYLVNKLKLDSESEIEIRCRGQQLAPFLTLEHVRDQIWSSREAAMATTLLSDSSTSTSTTDHIMVLHYGRCA